MSLGAQALWSVVAIVAVALVVLILNLRDARRYREKPNPPEGSDTEQRRDTARRLCRDLCGITVYGKGLHLEDVQAMAAHYLELTNPQT